MAPTVLSTVLLAYALAQAPTPEARLDFTSESPACRERALREAIAARLGYDPFVAAAPLSVTVRISGGQPLAAQVTVARAGASSATRALSGPPDCQSLINAVALTLAVAIDPLVLSRAPAVEGPAPAAAPPQAPAVAPSSAAAAPTLAPAPPAAPLHLSFTAGAGVDLGQQPAGLAGVRAGVRVSGASLLAFVEPTVDLPTRQDLAAGGALDTFFVGAGAGLCATTGTLAGCALVRGGALRFQGVALDETRQGWLPSFSGGVRASMEWPRESTVAVQASAELRVPLTRLRLLVGDAPAWEQPFVVGAIGAAVVVRVR